MERREFIKLAGAGAVSLAAGSPLGQAQPENTPRPNILWITCEDMSPTLGCFGDLFSISANLDALAQQGVRYGCAFTHAPVCAPSRSGLITGVYPQTLGTHHMRSKAPMPVEVRCFTEYVRQAGYYCSNCSKEDYNFLTPATAWDESSEKAHWRKRAEGQPFFSVFNLTATHEGQIRLPDDDFKRRTRSLSESERHDPGRVPVPPFHPDTPEVRKDWAQYYDLITVMDKQAGDILRELEQDGLAEDTIVFFFSDHGAGMPRCKRWLYDSGLHVPLIIRFPEKYRQFAPGAAGSTVDRLVGFVDFAPTVLSLAGVEIPAHMQGLAFLGSQVRAPRQYVYAGRDRMDERYDCSRAIRDGRYKYILNLMPHLSRGQFQQYMYEMPTMKVWAELKRLGKLQGPPGLFMEDTKPVEELYDVLNDPFEINNLAADPQYAGRLSQMREVLTEWMREIRDLGLLPESEMYKRANGRSFYELGKDNYTVPLAGLDADDAAGRFWGVMRLYQQQKGSSPEWLAKLEALLADPSPAVRVAAAGLLHRSRPEKALDTLIQELQSPDEWVRLQAANELDPLGPAAKPALEIFRKLVDDPNQYVVRVAQHAVKTSDSAPCE
ncbi:MAG: sulfatase-like hydrolase/transferase [Candidatus Hydrogenedentes bacterium]|nr:sulfatase-like hydrolase/transferase [Candidatus Hydrogenedentota bacterium]